MEDARFIELVSIYEFFGVDENIGTKDPFPSAVGCFCCYDVAMVKRASKFQGFFVCQHCDVPFLSKANEMFVAVFIAFLTLRVSFL